MKHSVLVLSFLLLPLLLGCGSSSSGSSSSADPSYDASALKKKYGDFSIQVATEGMGSYTYDEENNVYTLAVASTKAEYVLSGFFDGSIVIENVSGLASYKGVKLTLNDACLAYSGTSVLIDYALTDKNIEIKAQNGTYNYILNLGSNVAVHSACNIEFSGKGNLELASLGGEAHTIRADKDIYLYSAPTILVTASAHDAFHGNHLYFVEKDDTSNVYAGILTIHNVVSQAFDFETSNGNGSILVNSGKIYVDIADSVFKTDATLTILEQANVIATNIASDPYVAGDNSNGLAVSILGSFTVDGVKVTA